MADFAIDPAFGSASTPLCDLALCHVRLQLDARWPWLILIPRRPGVVEMEDLDAQDRMALMDEILAAGRAVKAIGVALDCPVQKLNIGALGNITRQLHVHNVGRRIDDEAWPGPVWGYGIATAYAPNQALAARGAALAALGV